QLDQKRKVVRSKLQGLSECVGSVSLAREVILENRSLLEPKSRLLGGVLGGGQLCVQQLDHHRPVAHFRKQAPRRTDVGQEPGRQQDTHWGSRRRCSRFFPPLPPRNRLAGGTAPQRLGRRQAPGPPPPAPHPAGPLCPGFAGGGEATKPPPPFLRPRAEWKR